MERGNEPAHPVIADNGTAYASAFRGMTIREAFAMAAMQGMARSLPFAAVDEMAAGVRGGRILATASVVMADALIEALKEAP